MILVDANLLLYAKIEGYPQHPRALSWLDERLNAPPRVGLPWPSLLAFLRIATNPRVFERPLASRDAWAQIEEWLGRPNVWIPVPGARHREVLAVLVDSIQPTSSLVPDTHLAALAIEHGLQLHSTDGDFGRFADLTWINPLA